MNNTIREGEEGGGDIIKGGVKLSRGEIGKKKKR
jgi:hypothetical protein